VFIEYEIHSGPIDKPPDELPPALKLCSLHYGGETCLAGQHHQTISNTHNFSTASQPLFSGLFRLVLKTPFCVLAGNSMWWERRSPYRELLPNSMEPAPSPDNWRNRRRKLSTKWRRASRVPGCLARNSPGTSKCSFWNPINRIFGSAAKLYSPDNPPLLLVTFFAFPSAQFSCGEIGKPRPRAAPAPWNGQGAGDRPMWRPGASPVTRMRTLVQQPSRNRKFSGGAFVTCWAARLSSLPLAIYLCNRRFRRNFRLSKFLRLAKQVRNVADDSRTRVPAVARPFFFFSRPLRKATPPGLSTTEVYAGQNPSKTIRAAKYLPGKEPPRLHEKTQPFRSGAPNRYQAKPGPMARRAPKIRPRRFSAAPPMVESLFLPRRNAQWRPCPSPSLQLFPPRGDGCRLTFSVNGGGGGGGMAEIFPGAPVCDPMWRSAADGLGGRKALVDGRKGWPPNCGRVGGKCASPMVRASFILNRAFERLIKRPAGVSATVRDACRVAASAVPRVAGTH